MSPKHFPILKLPLELREMIYDEVLTGTPREDALAYDISVSILRTCKQIHAEGQPFLFKNNVFEAAIWLPVPGYRPWPAIPSNLTFLSKIENMALYWDMRWGGIPSTIPNVVSIRLESTPMSTSILHLKHICMALIQAGTTLHTLKVTMKIPGSIDFGHMPLGQYPLQTPPFPLSGGPDLLAPLKELRVQQAVFAGDFSEATAPTVVYLHQVRAIMEGYRPEHRWCFPETNELNLDLMVRRNVYCYSSPESHPSWEGMLHRELFFYAEILRTFPFRTNGSVNKSSVLSDLETVTLMLGNPATAKLEGLRTMKLGPVLIMLENVFQCVFSCSKEWSTLLTQQGLLSVREYFMARPGVRKIMEDAKSAA